LFSIVAFTTRSILQCSDLVASLSEHWTDVTRSRKLKKDDCPFPKITKFPT